MTTIGLILSILLLALFLWFCCARFFARFGNWILTKAVKPFLGEPKEGQEREKENE